MVGCLFKMKKLTFYLAVNRIVTILLTFFLSDIKPFYKFILDFGGGWDGNSYTFIATHGYITLGPERNFIVFPPLYPILIKTISFLGINPILSGVIISNIFFILGMIVLYKLVESVHNKKVAVITVILISIFPTTYFFSVAYPESLFVFLFASSFYFAHKKSFLLSAFVGGLAAITRPFGLIIFPSILLFMLNAKKLNYRNLLSTTFFFVLPITPYVYINYALFGNPLAFAVFLEQNWQKSFDFPWNGISSSWKIGIQTQNSFSYKYFVGYAEGIASTVAWILTIFGIKKWGIKSPYILYLLLGTIFFTSTGFILSAPRYLLSIPPLFILFAELISKNKAFLFIWVSVSLGLFCWFSKIFALGQWAF